MNRKSIAHIYFDSVFKAVPTAAYPLGQMEWMSSLLF
jgi:hypothetical protein